MIDERVASDFTSPGGLVDRIRLAFVDYCHGIDLSDHRPGVNIKTAKQEGNRFIITKATQGDYLVHETYPGYRDETKAKGLAFGAFHYWDAHVSPTAQAEYFFGHVGDDLDLLPVWDIEKYGNSGVLEPTTAAQQISDGLQATADLFGRNPMIYTSRWHWQELTNNSPIIAAYPLWVASWTTASSPTLPVGATDWVFWQYTNQYRLPDYDKGLDGDRFNGNEGDFEEYLRLINGQQPTEPHTHPDLQQQIDQLTQALVDTNKRITKDLVLLDQRLTEQEARMAGVGSAAKGE